MKTLRTNANILAGFAVITMLVLALLGSVCPHHLSARDGTRLRDPILGWITICATSDAAAANQMAPGSPHGSSDHDCCASCPALAPLLIALTVLAAAFARPWQVPTLVSRSIDQTRVTSLLLYGGRGSRAPPAFA